MHLVQVIASHQCSPPIWVVTSGSQRVRPTDPVSVAQSALIGLGRTIQTEYPRLSCRLVDLDTNKPDIVARNLLQELLADDKEFSNLSIAH